MSLLRQRYLAAYPIKFTPTIRPPFWFWIGLNDLTDTMSDNDIIARALADYEEDKDDLEDVRRELIEDIYIKAYPYTADHDEGTPWCTVRIKELPLDMSEAEVISRALSDYEKDKSEIKRLNDYYQKRREEVEKEEE